LPYPIVTQTQGSGHTISSTDASELKIKNPYASISPPIELLLYYKAVYLSPQQLQNDLSWCWGVFDQ
jgi:hypothetical protein